MELNNIKLTKILNVIFLILEYPLINNKKYEC